VLLDMFEVLHEKPSVTIHPDRGISTGHFEGDSMLNHDSLTSIEIGFPGRRLLIDAVFDGVGGYPGGEAASTIARETLEIAALSGWICGPEDVRRVLILADIIMKLEKSVPDLENMSTTAAISMIVGTQFYGMHAGDSYWKVFRDGQLLFSSIPQEIGRFITSNLGLTPDILINNDITGYSPLDLMGGDGILTADDGITDVVCDHEMEQVVSVPGIKEGQVLRDIFILTESRSDPDIMYDLLCGCSPRRGKYDDRSGLFRFVKLE